MRQKLAWCVFSTVSLVAVLSKCLLWLYFRSSHLISFCFGLYYVTCVFYWLVRCVTIFSIDDILSHKSCAVNYVPMVRMNNNLYTSEPFRQRWHNNNINIISVQLMSLLQYDQGLWIWVNSLIETLLNKRDEPNKSTNKLSENAIFRTILCEYSDASSFFTLDNTYSR